MLILLLQKYGKWLLCFGYSFFLLKTQSKNIITMLLKIYEIIPTNYFANGFLFNPTLNENLHGDVI